VNWTPDKSEAAAAAMGRLSVPGAPGCKIGGLSATRAALQEAVTVTIRRITGIRLWIEAVFFIDEKSYTYGDFVKSGLAGPNLPFIGLEQFFDRLAGKFRDLESQGKTWIVFSGFDRVNRLTRDPQFFSKVRLRPIVLGSNHAKTVLHWYRLHATR
jgi:hypothetical protein